MINKCLDFYFIFFQKHLCGLHCYLYLEQIICDKNLSNYIIYRMTCTQLPNVSLLSQCSQFEDEAAPP